VIISDFTSTITGTPHYIAPEILRGKGYSFSCDYWSVGIICFEVFFNFYPFGNSAKDPMDVYKDVIKKYESYYKKCKIESLSFLKQKTLEAVLL